MHVLQKIMFVIGAKEDPCRYLHDNIARIILDFHDLGRFRFQGLGRIPTKNDMISSKILPPGTISDISDRFCGL